MVTFKLNEAEQTAANDFIEKHLTCVKEHPTTIGGSISYTFTPTGVGTGVEIQCNICKTKTDITDYGNW